jgi:hypothetical protein
MSQHPVIFLDFVTSPFSEGLLACQHGERACFEPKAREGWLSQWPWLRGRPEATNVTVAYLLIRNTQSQLCHSLCDRVLVFSLLSGVY